MNKDYAKESVKAQIAVRLAEVLEAENCDEKELAKRLTLKQNDIAEIMSADANVSIELLAEIAFVLGKKVDIRFI